MKLLSIDIGILHLGLSVTDIDDEYETPTIQLIDLIDITKYTHDRMLSKDTCTLYHTRNVCDRLNHFIEDYMDIFDTVDIILIEQQPIMGITSVEQLILNRFRNKTIKISPQRMHRFFRIHIYDYETRKIKTESIARKYLLTHHQKQLDTFVRAHDITDSICIMLYWVNEQRIIYENKVRKQEMEDKFLKFNEISMDEFFNQYKYQAL